MIETLTGVDIDACRDLEGVLLSKLIREPLAHFMLIGLMLFFLFNVISGRQGGADRRIVINHATVAAIVQRYQSMWQRPPTPAELNGLIETYVREEILYREGVAMGLDRDDPVVRRRVLQKLGVITEESAAQSAPSDADLEAYLKSHAARYASPTVIDFEQVMFDPVRHGVRLEADFEAAFARLTAGADPGTLGDSTLLPATAAAVPADLLARDYGDGFAKTVLALPVGIWQGPVRSGYGIHLVRVTRQTPGLPARLVEARDAVVRDWESDRRIRANEDYTQKLRASYDVVMEVDLQGEAMATAKN